jgi:hypothetical protein
MSLQRRALEQPDCLRLRAYARWPWGCIRLLYLLLLHLRATAPLLSHIVGFISFALALPKPPPNKIPKHSRVPDEQPLLFSHAL